MIRSQATKPGGSSLPPMARFGVRRPFAAQAKLRVGAPGDRFENEADRVADQVMRMSQPGGRERNSPFSIFPVSTQRIQRLCPECREELRRQELPEEEEETVQTKSDGNRTRKVGHDLEVAVNSLHGGGRPLDPGLRAFFEPRFSHDFSRVRVHTDQRAADTANALNARAYTLGNDIAFAAGGYVPQTMSGGHLLAHELTHVLQQDRTINPSHPVDRLIRRQPQNCTAAITNVDAPRSPTREVTDAHNVARSWAQTAFGQIQNAVNGRVVNHHARSSLRHHFANPNRARLIMIRNIFRRIVRRLNRGTRIYFCNTSTTRDCRLADTEAATFCPSASQYTRLCPQFFTIARLEQPITLVHEAAHAAGACGHIYTDQANYPGGNPQTNAEAYAQFARTVGLLVGGALPPLRRTRPPLVPP